MLVAYERLFGEKPTGYSLPQEKGDHPELDMSPELNEEGRAIYMSLVGQSQWLISLGRFDIACAIMTIVAFSSGTARRAYEEDKKNLWVHSTALLSLIHI